jgi:hypothetical protein
MRRSPRTLRGLHFAGVLFPEAIIMNESEMIGVDLGKHRFHLHGQVKSSREVFRKKPSRPQMMRFFGNLSGCTVVMKACACAYFVAFQLIVKRIRPN